MAAYALDVQTSLNLLSSDAAYNCSTNMLAAVGALVEMQGIVRMMGQICTGVVFEQRGSCGVMKELEGGPWRHKNLATTWWTTLRTLLAHRCWRYFPKLAVKLPEILLGGSFNGVKLQNEIFQEPASSPEAEPDKWKRGALRRSARFEHVMHALGRLMHWAMAERRAFMTRTMGVAPPTSKRVQQAVGCEDLPHVEDVDVSGVHAFEESDESADDSGLLERETRSFVRPRVSPLESSAVSKGVIDDNVLLIDLLSDHILPASTVADAAFDLDVECSKLFQVPRSLKAEDITCVLTACADTAEAEQQYEETDSDDSDSDLEDEVRNQHQLSAAASHPEASESVEFRNSEEATCLAKLYMATKGQSPPNSDSQRKQRQAFRAVLVRWQRSAQHRVFIFLLLIRITLLFFLEGAALPKTLTAHCSSHSP